MSAEVTFRDDESISDDAVVYRRISPSFINWKLVDAGVAPRIPSQGFQDQPAELARAKFGLPGACMSVDLATVLAERGVEPQQLLVGFLGYGLVSLRVGTLRQLKGSNGEDWGQGVMRDPRPDAPWHAVSFARAGKKTKGMQSAISGVASWVVIPQQA